MHNHKYTPPSWELPEGFPATAIWRGYGISTKEWAYGYFGIFLGRPTIYHVHIGMYGEMHPSNRGTVIDPATLSQCTGIRDRNAAWIFVGDMVEWNGRVQARISWNRIRFLTTHVTGFYDWLDWSPGISVVHEATITGTIHEKGGCQE